MVCSPLLVTARWRGYGEDPKQIYTAFPFTFMTMSRRDTNATPERGLSHLENERLPGVAAVLLPHQ